LAQKGLYYRNILAYTLLKPLLVVLM
jgi:hypothetical protein